jgi:SRSO17 transposase
MRRTAKGYRMELEAFVARVFEGFSRWDQVARGATYVRGLMREAERKSPGAMATYMTEVNEQALRHFVTDSPWDFDNVRRRLTECALEKLPAEGRFLIVDETGFPKQGKHSVGVARQYGGTLGKVGNGQVAVRVHLATKEVSVPLDGERYLPESWTNDASRLAKCRVPEAAPFRTKPELALLLLERLRGWGVERYPVVADAA